MRPLSPTPPEALLAGILKGSEIGVETVSGCSGYLPGEGLRGVWP